MAIDTPVVATDALDRMFEVGHEFYTAIHAMKLDPEALFWMNWAKEDRFELVMVSSLADRIGPLPIYEALFRAQDAGLLPDDLNLFDLSLYSPKSEIGGDALRVLSAFDGDGTARANGVEEAHINATGLLTGLADPSMIFGRGVYVIKSTGYSAIEDRKRWKRFERELERRAA